MEIERPEEHEAGGAGELYCWMPSNEDRECNASCVAFESTSLADARVGQCMVLNALRSFGISAANVVKMLRVKERQEAVAAASPPPPEVRT
jgi:hypothetical protein